MQYCSIEKANEIIEHKINEANRILSLDKRGFVMPQIEWVDMGVRVAGRHIISQNKIELNSNYLKSEDWNKFLDDTPLHELAHAIDWQFYNSRGHKSTWKRICYSLGLQGNRCHNFSRPVGLKVVTRTKKRYKASCGCRNHIITSVKYNRIKKGIVYVCTKCNGELKNITQIDM